MEIDNSSTDVKKKGSNVNKDNREAITKIKEEKRRFCPNFLKIFFGGSDTKGQKARENIKMDEPGDKVYLESVTLEKLRNKPKEAAEKLEKIIKSFQQGVYDLLPLDDNPPSQDIVSKDRLFEMHTSCLKFSSNLTAFKRATQEGDAPNKKQLNAILDMCKKLLFMVEELAPAMEADAMVKSGKVTVEQLQSNDKLCSFVLREVKRMYDDCCLVMNRDNLPPRRGSMTIQAISKDLSDIEPFRKKIEGKIPSDKNTRKKLIQYYKKLSAINNELFLNKTSESYEPAFEYREESRYHAKTSEYYSLKTLVEGVETNLKKLKEEWGNEPSWKEKGWEPFYEMAAEYFTTFEENRRLDPVRIKQGELLFTLLKSVLEVDDNSSLSEAPDLSLLFEEFAKVENEPKIATEDIIPKKLETIPELRSKLESLIDSCNGLKDTLQDPATLKKLKEYDFSIDIEQEIYERKNNIDNHIEDGRGFLQDSASNEDTKDTRQVYKDCINLLEDDRKKVQGLIDEAEKGKIQRVTTQGG